MLGAVYEARGFSYGFRPGRNSHLALAALHTALMNQRVNCVLDADIRGFYDSVGHEWLLRMMAHRVAYPRILNLIRMWMKAGVLESNEWHDTERGTQGASVSAARPGLSLQEEMTRLVDFRRLTALCRAKLGLPRSCTFAANGGELFREA